jgi:hypothetical protein
VQSRLAEQLTSALVHAAICMQIAFENWRMGGKSHFDAFSLLLLWQKRTGGEGEKEEENAILCNVSEGSRIGANCRAMPFNDRDFSLDALLEDVNKLCPCSALCDFFQF